MSPILRGWSMIEFRDVENFEMAKFNFGRWCVRGSSSCTDKTTDVIITGRLACGKNLTSTVLRCVRFTVFTCCLHVIKCSSPGGFYYGNRYLYIMLYRYFKIWYYTAVVRPVVLLLCRVLLFLINSVFFFIYFQFWMTYN